MNRKGFAITAVLYSILIVFILLITFFLKLLSNKINFVINNSNTLESAYEMSFNYSICSSLNEEYVTIYRGLYKISTSSYNGYLYLPANSKIKSNNDSSILVNNEVVSFSSNSNSKYHFVKIQNNSDYSYEGGSCDLSGSAVVYVKTSIKELEIIDLAQVNSPILAEGMIPVKWNGSNWVKADSTNLNNDWYDYKEKKWANAVMVKDSSRSKYMSAANGTTISESDVLAYYVWIPRYKYQLFNVNAEKMAPIEINVKFEKDISAKSVGSNNGEWLTHPAFTIGDKELTGIWVGKFETSGTASKPTIKAGLITLTNQKVSAQFITAQKITSGTTYLTQKGTSQIDAHMMKNTEWGAIAYLKQSKYGLGTTDIGNNSYYGSSTPPYKAGCGPKDASNLTTYTSTCTSYTGGAGVMSSTTGNVYGVYDMAGGAGEYVMGVMQDNTNTNTPMSGKDSNYNSGFTGKIYNSGNYTLHTGTSFPSSIYYDLYAFGTTDNDSSAYARRILGDATSEATTWYADKTYFLTPSAGPWFFRGGYVGYASGAGLYTYANYPGNADVWVGFRIALWNNQ